MELLEPRIAPASLTFLDVDGDTVTLKTSKGSQADLLAAIDGQLFAPDPLSPQHFQLQGLLLGDNPVFAHTSVTITAKTAGGAVSSVNVGFISADGVDLGAVRVDGDLGRIIAGDANAATKGLKSLTVQSMGVEGLATQAAGATSLGSRVLGAMGALKVAGDFKDASLQVLGVLVDPDPNVSSTEDSRGQIGSIKIGGSLIGGAAQSSGAIFAKGKIGSVTIGGSVLGGDGRFSGGIITERTMQDVIVGLDVQGGTLAGGSELSGRIFAGVGMGSISVGRDILGGTGIESGSLSSGLGMGSITIKGRILGSSGELSGSVGSGGEIGKINVTGSILGGGGERSGAIQSTTAMKAVIIGGDLKGGDGLFSGIIASSLTISSLTIKGSVLGGNGSHSGSVGSATPLGAVRVMGDVMGGMADSSGQIVSTGTIKSVTIDGSLIGGGGFESGAVGSIKGLGPVFIGKDLIAGTASRSGLIVAQAGGESNPPFPDIARVTIEGSIIGTPLPEFGAVDPEIFNAGGILADGDIGAVKIGVDIRGGAIGGGAFVQSFSKLASLTVDGSVEGGVGEQGAQIYGGRGIGSVVIGDNLKGGAGFASANIRSGLDIDSVKIGGSILGGAGQLSGQIRAGQFIDTSEGLSGGDIRMVSVGGAIEGGAGVSSGSIDALGNLGSVSVGGLVGGPAQQSGLIHSRGNIAAIVVHGSVEGGAGDRSGVISSEKNISSIVIEGNVLGGSGSYQPDTGLLHDGQIEAVGEIGSIRIVGNAAEGLAGDIRGGTGASSAMIRAASIKNVFVNGCIHGNGPRSASIIASSGDLGTIVIGEDLETEDALEASAQISAAGSIGSLTVEEIKGRLDNRVYISAVDAIGKISIGDSTHFADILAGYDEYRETVKAGARIGSVVVGTGSGEGNWEATNLVASVIAGNGSFGSVFDYAAASQSTNPPVSEISSLVIKGKVIPVKLPVRGGPSGFEGSFGIEAELIGSARVGGIALVLKSGASNDLDPIPLGGDESHRADTFLFEVKVGQVGQVV